MGCLQCVVVFLLMSTAIADDRKTATRTRSSAVTTITGTTTPPFDRQDYRLPAHVRPKRYKVELKPHIYGTDSSNFFFEGSAKIHVECVSVTDIITIHMNGLNISDSDISVKQENNAAELFGSSSDVEVLHFLHLHLTKTLEVGKVYVIEFRHFSAPMSTVNMGMYVSQYQDGNETVYLAASLMSPVHARKVFPCFDEPHLKATFDITLVRRSDTGRNYFSLSNAPLASSSDIRDEDGVLWTKDQFERSPIMSTYLVAFTICDFPHLENTTASDPNVKFRTYARLNAIQWAKRPHEDGLRVFDWLNRNFRPKYSHALSKLDSIVMPDINYGGMENWGQITYMDSILYQPGVTSAKYEFWAATLITHEIAHMWFGNCVSPLWWDWMWIKEALSSWCGIHVLQEVNPNWRVVENWVSQYLYEVLDIDALPTSHAMTADVLTPSEISANLDDIPYVKGPHVMHMIQSVMGFETFIAGLNLFLERHQYGSADTAGLFSALDEKMVEHDFEPRYISRKMDSWVSQMGYPVVMVTRTATGYNLTQRRFLIGSENSEDGSYQWEIPIVYATSENTNMTKSRDDIRWLNKNHFLHIPDSTANVSNGWILINVQQMGYYRVLYDTDTWRALVRQLNTDPSVIPAISRGQLINDAWSLVNAGMLNMLEALLILDFLQSETELAPWRAFAKEIDYVELMLERTCLFQQFRTRIQDILRQTLRHVPLNIDDSMVPSDVAVRTLLAKYAVKYGLEEYTSEAIRLFQYWKTTGTNERITVNLRYSFYCTAVAEGDATDWEFLYTQFKSSDDSSELMNLRHGLSCTRNETLLRRLLDMTLDETEIRKHDVYSTIYYVTRNPLSRPTMAFEFYKNNYEHFKNSLTSWFQARILEYVTEHFNTEDELKELQRFSDGRDVTIINATLHQVIARTQRNVDWLCYKLGAFCDWLTPTDTSAPGACSDSCRF